MQSPGEKRIRTLVVDDSQEMLKFLCTFLKKIGILSVEATAENGEKALQQVESLRPDLVLMDVQMPIMDGLEATRRIRQRFPDVRVILVTLHENPDVRPACEAAGAHGYVPKRRLVKDLAAEIRRIFAEAVSSGTT